MAGSTLHVFLSTFSVFLAAELVRRLYSSFIGPLSAFPGPKSRGFSSIPKLFTLIGGREHSDLVALHEKYGPVVRVAPNELSFASGAQAWKDIIGFKKSDQAGFPKDERFYGGQMFPKKNVMMVSADDAGHSKLRKAVSDAFADKSLRDVEPMLLGWAKKFNDKLEERVDDEGLADMVKYYNCATFDIMGDLAFSEDLGMLEQGDENAWVKTVFAGIKASTFIRALKNCGQFGWWIVDNVLTALPVAQKGVRKTLDYSTVRIERRLNRVPERPDLWSQILAKSELDPYEHEAQAFFFMVAGTETTASALSGITYYLLQNPDYMARLKAEVRAAYSSFDEITLESLTHLEYMRAVIQEGLRMYPPVPIALPRRSPPQGAVVDGMFIPGNVVCGVHHFSTNQMSRHFKNASEFHPERWLGDPAYSEDQLDAVQVFHVGPRNCVGKNLAWYELRLLLATTVLVFDLELTPECRSWRARNLVYTVWQKPPLWCRLRRARK